MEKMKRARILIAAAVILIAAVVSAALTSAFAPAGRTLGEEDKTRINRRFDGYIGNRGFSGAVYAVYHGKEIYDKGAGQAADGAENGTDIAYGAASLTKQFTAASIMQLYQAGRLDIDDTIDKYFPEYRYSGRITVKQLLCQRSGIPDYMVNSVGDAAIVSCYGGGKKYVKIEADGTAEENREKIREFFFSMELLFEPGSRFDYSDSNYALLAEIVSKVSGLSYHDYVRRRIFEPLKMEHSAFIDDYEDGFATVAETDRKEFKTNYYDFAGLEYGCGDILTTPKDLYLWYKGLTKGKVVSKEYYEMMTENYSGEDETGYGFGLMVSDKSDSKVVYHYGYIPAYCSAVFYIPEYDYFQATVSNHSTGDPHKMAADMAKYFGTVIDLDLVDIE